MDKDAIREAYEAFIEEGGKDALDSIEDELSIGYGKLDDLIDKLDDLSEHFDSEHPIRECLATLRRAQFSVGDAHSHIQDANTDALEEIENLMN